MQGHRDRILTTHVGSLPRTVEVLDAMKARRGGEDVDKKFVTASATSSNARSISESMSLPTVKCRRSAFSRISKSG